MTLKEIYAMFEIGQQWEAVNSFNPKANGLRTLLEKKSTQLVWATPTCPRAWMPFPKASSVVEASDGKLVFRLHDAKDCIPAMNNWSVDDTLTLTRVASRPQKGEPGA